MIGVVVGDGVPSSLLANPGVGFVIVVLWPVAGTALLCLLSKYLDSSGDTYGYHGHRQQEQQERNQEHEAQSAPQEPVKPSLTASQAVREGL